MVGDRDREKGRDNEKESENRPLGSRLQVVKTLIGGLDRGQKVTIGSEKVTKRPTKLMKSTKTAVSNGDIRSRV